MESVDVIQKGSDPRPSVSVAAIAKRGVVWVSAVSLGSKVLSVLSQIVLAALLVPEDFGLVSLVLTVSAISTLTSDTAVHPVLLRHQRRLDVWAPTAFRLCVIGGVVSSLLTAALAPLAASVYDEPQLKTLLLIQAFCPLLSSLAIVPTAYLRAQLRFRATAMIAFVRTVLQTSLTICFAYAGLGALSFVLAALPALLAVLVLSWIFAKPPVMHAYNARAARKLLGEFSLMALAGAFITVASNADYAVLGLLHSSDTVGTYFFAFNLAQQSFYLVTASVISVLQPALSQHAGDPLRQTRAYLRAARAIAIFLMPMCALQLALTRPGMELLFGPKWEAAIPVVQVLTVGWIFHSVSSTGYSVLEAQARFSRVLTLRIISGCAVAALAWIGASIGGAVAVAWMMTIYFAVLMGPMLTYLAVRPGGGRLADVFQLYFRPVVISALSIAPFIVDVCRETPMLSGFSQIVLYCSWFCSIYAAGLKFGYPETWAHLLASFRGRLSPIRR